VHFLSQAISLTLFFTYRALALAAANDQAFAFQKRKVTEPPAQTHSNVTSSATPSVEKSEEIEVQHRRPALPPTLTHRLLPIRTIPPFIAEHDIPRGILFALQMFLGYLLMLAVMYVAPLNSSCPWSDHVAQDISGCISHLHCPCTGYRRDVVWKSRSCPLVWVLYRSHYLLHGCIKSNRKEYLSDLWQLLWKQNKSFVSSKL